MYTVQAKMEMVDWLSKFGFTHHITLSFARNVSPGSANKSVKNWRSAVERIAKMQIGYCGVYNQVPYPHVHLLVLACNHQGNTLFDITDNQWARINRYFPGDVKVDPMTDRRGICEYLVHKNLPDNRSEALEPCNTGLLNRYKVKEVDGMRRRTSEALTANTQDQKDVKPKVTPIVPIEDCPSFDKCDAPLCPLDTRLKDRIWYADESVCNSRKFGKHRWIQKQRSIAKRQTKSWLDRPITYQELFDSSRQRRVSPERKLHLAKVLEKARQARLKNAA